MLIKKAKEQTGKILVVDESAMALDRYDTSQSWLSKTSRHLGHNAIFIGQRLKDVSLDIRSQCDQVFIFRCSRTDAKIVDDEYDDQNLLKCTHLKKFCFAWITPEATCFGRVDPNSLTTTIIPAREATEKYVDIEEANE
jgi:ABC-type sugar transport system ATPase subunit